MMHKNLTAWFTLYCQSFLYEIISGLRSACLDVASSSSAPPASLTTKPTNELLSEAIPNTDTVYLFSFLHEFYFRCFEIVPFDNHSLMKQDGVLVEDNDHNTDDPENFEVPFVERASSVAL